MRNYFIALAIVLLTGCSNAKSVYKLYEGNAVQQNEVATVIGEYNKSTQELLLSTFKDYDVTLNIFGTITEYGAPAITHVNGKAGTDYNSFMGKAYYNNSSSGHFEFKLKPGVHTFTVIPNSFQIRSNQPVANIKANFQAGHKYYIGQILTDNASTYRWQPVLVDETSNKLIYPK